MSLQIILYQIGILVIITLIGAGIFRLKIVNDQARNFLEKLVFNVTTPLLILTKISSLTLHPGILRNGLFVILFAYLVILIQMAAGKFSARILKLQPAQAVIHQLHTYMGNIVFLGFPLIDALFPGGEALLYGALYQLVSNSVQWTHGVIKLAPGNGSRGLAQFRNLINPNTVSLIAALVLLLLNIKLPRFLMDSLGGLGSTTIYLAMLYIGIQLAQSNFLHVIRRVDALVLAMNKLLLIPILLMFLAGWLISLLSSPISFLAFSVVILQSAMPCMTLLVIMAKRYGGDDTRAMEYFVVSTLLSVITLPVVICLLGLVEKSF
ncbi:MAG TPA: AEC family transporter [Bacteroidales bacterium]|nr:AEC family transporter [Bacteroidales bacterium]